MDTTLKLDHSIVEEKLDKNWMDLVGPGWPWRTLKRGIYMTLGIGIPVGALIGFTSAPGELPRQSPWLMVLAFTGMTATYAIPGAFLMRWFGVRLQRKMRYDPAFRTKASP